MYRLIRREVFNRQCITLCEVSPGIIWAGGFTSGIYKINKNTLSVEYFSPYLLSHDNMRPDKYIRDIVKDSRGYIWSGGYYNLKCFNLATNSVRLYPGLNSITSIVEKDKDNMWIGTVGGLYLLNRNTGEYQFIEMEIGAAYKLSRFLDSPKDYGKPWYGQLMAGPQMIAYLLQVNYWLEKYQITLNLS